MAIETLKESLLVNQMIGKVKENIITEEDVIIPDVKPDILSTIHTSGTVCIYKKEILDGKIKIEGGVQVYVVYLADGTESNIRGINTTLNFTKIIDIKDVNSNMNLELKTNLRDVDCKIINGRKINIKAVIDVNVFVYSNQNVEFVKDVNNAEQVQILKNEVCINSLLGMGRTKAYAKDTITIDNTDSLAEIVKTNFNIINKEIKISYNKVLAKSDLIINLAYLNENNIVKEINWKIPVMGFIDIQNISEENECTINYEIKNILIKPNSIEEHSIYVEVEIEIECSAFDSKTINIIKDLYSPRENVEIKQKNIVVMQDKKIMNQTCNIKEKLNIPELQNNKISASEIKPRIIKESIENGKIIYEGELKITLIYVSKMSNRLETKIITVPFNTNVDCEDLDYNSNLITNIEICSSEFNVLQDESLQVNVEIEMNIDANRMSKINVIDSVNFVEEDCNKIYSIVVYFVKPGDTLWKIAKRFKSTVTAISTVNEIEDENKLNIGQQLFIPKYVC